MATIQTNMITIDIWFYCNTYFSPIIRELKMHVFAWHELPRSEARLVYWKFI